MDLWGLNGGFGCSFPQLKKEQLKKLENQQSNSTNPNKNYWPWILGGIGVLGLIGIIIYFFTKKKKDQTGE